MTKDNKKIIPVFFAADENYIPFISVGNKITIGYNSLKEVTNIIKIVR